MRGGVLQLDLIGVGWTTLGALLGFSVHARSRWRGRGRRVPLGAARREDRAPRRLPPHPDARRVLAGVKPAPHRRHMGGHIAATAADDARAAIHGQSGVSFHQLRVRNSGFQPHAIAARRRWPWRSGAPRLHPKDRRQEVGGADAAIRRQ